MYNSFIEQNKRDNKNASSYNFPTCDLNSEYDYVNELTNMYLYYNVNSTVTSREVVGNNNLVSSTNSSENTVFNNKRGSTTINLPSHQSSAAHSREVAGNNNLVSRTNSAQENKVISNKRVSSTIDPSSHKTSAASSKTAKKRGPKNDLRPWERGYIEFKSCFKKKQDLKLIAREVYSYLKWIHKQEGDKNFEKDVSYKRVYHYLSNCRRGNYKFKYLPYYIERDNNSFIVCYKIACWLL